ncbi:membrane protein [Mycolicibacterium litorale]|uniref:Membrane protein n=1 Tax=Mycolicibacterium litorale TaxID=758802 RepID=A0AAD1IMV1_9MYCO|nr:membrane protein [Mycolicibacterium litorale]
MIAVLAVLVVVAGLVIAYVASQRFGSQPVEGELGAYRLIDDQTVEVTVSVTREDPSRPAVCIVRARSLDGSETGRREILVPPSEATTVQVTTVVKSSRPPVIGDVYGCGLDVPPYLVAP